MSETQPEQHRAAPRAQSQRGPRARRAQNAEDTRAGVTVAPQTSESFSPGEPIRPTPGLSGPGGSPRQWSFPVGYNIAQYPRATEQTSFAQLRSLAALYDGAQLCERVYFDMLGRLEAHVTPRTESIVEGEHATSPQLRETARRIEGFLESPDRSQDLRAWLVAFVRDPLEIDAVAVYTRRTRGGDLYALELVDGTTIKPLLDGAGRTPASPAAAYQQFLYGAPAGWYSRDEMDYIRETARTESPYGISRIERIVLRMNQALRKQSFDLARFTDGATPLGLIQPPDGLSWTPEQLESFERAFNGLLAGSDRMRVRARALPPGATWRALAGDDPLVEFDRFLLNVTVAAFGLTMDELGFTSDSNRSVGQSQENVVYRRAVAPIVTLIAAYLTRKVRRWFDDRFTVSFGGFEEPEDFAARADAFAKLIPLGVITPAHAARMLKLPESGR